MEQATNQFTKGLQLDTHPMVQSNDTLTDCLNGTLITMNGNEVILQNDMGNRRVDKAFLPPGYEPVGIKEYGGIIYVASYNPITNKSQIGSFPSPQKKLSSIDEGLSGIFDFNNFTSSYNVETDETLGLEVLKSDSFMLPLTKDLNLRAGDKFAVYSEGLSSLSSLLTNYNNTSGNKAYSPKNRKYTLQLGVLNSQNEFVDITKSLCRWKSQNGTWQPVNYSSEVSDIYKFNDGYFISDAFTNTFNAETIEDAKLIKERQKIAANTYAYKLVGPLYLKLQFNHIENFNYNIYGLYDGGQATLWIEGFLTYNCPDNSLNTSGVNNEDENYATFDEGIPSSSFGFNLKGHNPVDTQISRSIYNPNNNTYSVKVVKKYTGITGTRGTIFDYVIGVKADIDDESIYLRGLSVAGSIDLALLGSGTLKFNGWRFYNNLGEDSNNSVLTFAFNAYPEYGKSFVNLTFRFRDITSNSGDILYPKGGEGLPIYNGRQTLKFSWSEIGLKERTTYQVTAFYYIKDNDTGTIGNPITVPESSPRWFLTTELFNDFYNGNSGIADFCNVTLNNTTQDVYDDFYGRMVIDYANKSKVVNNSVERENMVGSLISTFDAQISYLCEHTHLVDITIDPELAIKNENKYPSYVEIPSARKKAINVSSVKVIQVGDNDELGNHIANTDYSDVLRPQLLEIQGRNLQEIQGYNPIDKLRNHTTLLQSNVEIDSNNFKHITGNIKFYDAFKSYGETITTITNGFDNFSELIEQNREILPFSGHYAGVIADFDSIGLGSQNKHYLEVARNQDTMSRDLPPNHELPSGWVEIEYERGDSRQTFNISEFLGTIYQHFNKSVEDTDISFLYFFCPGNYFPNGETLVNGKNGAMYTRAWWKMPNGEWACFRNLFELKRFDSNTINEVKSFKSFLKSELGNKELVYCMYDATDNNSILYAPRENYIYYNRYDLPMKYRIDYVLTTQNIVSTGNNIGNLHFSVTNNPTIPFDEVEFKLTSSEKFYDNIHSVNSDNISNVYLKTGERVDSQGRTLNPSFVYCLDENTNQLVRLDRSDYYVDAVNKSRGKNRLLYNTTRKSSVENKFQSAGNGEVHTVIKYDSVNIVQSV